MIFSRHRSIPLSLLLACLLLFPNAAIAGHHKEGPTKKAIVLAAFGTSYPQALGSILNIKSTIEKAHPDIPVRLAFTSSIIRSIWHGRQNDLEWQKAHTSIPQEMLTVKSPLATIAELQNDGFKDITVQSLHVFAGEEFQDLKNLMTSLRSIRTVKAKSQPFKKLALGRPALGMPGDQHPYTEDIAVAVQALKGDVDEARKLDAALVYMGHGNDFFSTGIYAEFQREMRATHEYPVFVACVEGFPDFNDMLADLKKSGKRTILLQPFMIVAGDHATNDMAGSEDDSWKTMLTQAGFTVTTRLRGLGSVDSWAAIYAAHLNDAMSQKHLLR
ncbi:sirohydrochlorin cobaltochelatase [Pseudodesulfovibrio piezophilus]|uniref:Anaerobic cobalt chelatase n=1 Tax=Pseudodesulfovibrio piezophilus (strain DSM 21447 / JCM 15486 / C1TLV30) TaxID=1322246 RepID=M1WNP6_PSEP2|nr:sirohydrochlorin cobaltochelatase [Pseudodesulfovibrio piezophilus]CCH50490.1 Anaerobic cobalt chelatase [Pseudodesulfovibrio piezophilus C1TLV30]